MIKMGEMCISLNEVKPKFRKKLTALDKKPRDKRVCKSEVSGVSESDFEAFINSMRIDPLMEIEGKKIHKSQLDGLTQLAGDVGVTLEEILERVTVKDGNVTELNLNGTKVSDISALVKLTNLRVLYLIGTPVSDIRPLAKLTNLRLLLLFGTQVSDIRALAKLTNLKEINLGETPVSDISALAKLKNLESLILITTNVSKMQVMKMEKAFPHLNIFY